jgi:ApaG protein
MSSAVTQGIRVTVESVYVPANSDPRRQRYVFAYRVVIANEGDRGARLESRHWVITDASGETEEVRGPGVVGETPYLRPGEAHRYQSFCVLKTPRGTMHGSYQMVRDDGSGFDAEIAPFVVTTPSAESQRVLN